MSIWWSEDDRAFLVEAPELAGAMADGTTPEEAVANAHEVIESRIAFAREHGATSRSQKPKQQARADAIAG